MTQPRNRRVFISPQVTKASPDCGEKRKSTSPREENDLASSSNCLNHSSSSPGLVPGTHRTPPYSRPVCWRFLYGTDSPRTTLSLLSVQLRSTSDTPSPDSHPRHLAFSASLLIPTMPDWLCSYPCLFLEVCIPPQGSVSSAGIAALSRMQPCGSVTNTCTHSIIVIERGRCQLKKDEVINLERSTLLLTERCELSVAVLTGWEAQPL